MSKPLSVLFAGGGTGGHLFPGIAIAEALLQVRADAQICFVGSTDRIEARVVPRLGYPFHAIWIAGLKRTVSFGILILPLKVAVALVQSASVLRKRKPQVVVGTGGYVSGPVVYTAARMGHRTLIHEQNEYPGMTTRKLAGLVDEVHVTYESTLEHLRTAKRMVVSGNPVRPSLIRHPEDQARQTFGFDPSRKTVFVFGGSLGASSINTAIRALLPRFAEEDVQLLWQTGSRDHTMIEREAARFGSRVVVREFIHEMDLAYSASTLVVCRAGATSLAELTALGIPSILVPYPHAAADHQRRNARAMEAKGAANVVEDHALAELEPTLFDLLRSPEKLDQLRSCARAAGRPQAAADIAKSVIELATRQGGGE